MDLMRFIALENNPNFLQFRKPLLYFNASLNAERKRRSKNTST
jgi:hypothetical protein